MLFVANRTLLISRGRAIVSCAIVVIFFIGSQTASAFGQRRGPALSPDAQTSICDPIDRELIRSGQRFRSAYERGTLKFFKSHRGPWREEPPAAGRQLLLDIFKADMQPNLNMRTAQEREAVVDKLIREHRLIYSLISTNIPDMRGKYNVARIGVRLRSLTRSWIEYRYVISAGKLAVGDVNINFLRSTYRALVIGRFFYLVNEDGNVVIPYFVEDDGGMLENPLKWNVSPGCQIKIKNL